MLLALLAAWPAEAREDEPAQDDPAQDDAEEDAHRLVWRPEWRPFQLGDAIWTGLMVGGFVYFSTDAAGRETPSRRGPILFDHGVRSALRAETLEGRERAGLASDIAWWTPVGMGIGTSLIVPLIDDFNWEVMLQLTAISGQAYAFSGFMVRSGHQLIGRERPDVASCRGEGDCAHGTFQSFPSGHVAGAFTAAGFGCVHHLQLGLFGHIAADAAYCATMLGLSTANATLRIVADRHYATDILGGLAIGLGSGIGIPLLFHYAAPGWQPLRVAADPSQGAVIVVSGEL